MDKLIFCKIWDERKDRNAGDPYEFQVFSIDKEDEPDDDKRRRKENEQLNKRIKALYEEGRKKDAEVFRDDIRLTPEKIRTVVSYLESINLGETDLDAKGRAFEAFMGDFFRGNFGQYFTPRPIVKFAVEVLPINNDSLVLDTSCGSGGFLLYALDKVRKKADALYPNFRTDAKQKLKHYRYCEFTRVSSNNRVTLIIEENSSPVRTLWSLMLHSNLDDCINALMTREGTTKENIHYTSVNDTSEDNIKSTIKKWLSEKNIVSAIWTGLSYSKKTNNKRPALRDIVKHLEQLAGNERRFAEEYIRNAPRQIDTEYRREIENKLGWKWLQEK